MPRRRKKKNHSRKIVTIAPGRPVQIGPTLIEADRRVSLTFKGPREIVIREKSSHLAPRDRH